MGAKIEEDGRPSLAKQILEIRTKLLKMRDDRSPQQHQETIVAG